MKTALITGSSGLIGAEAVRFFAKKGYHIIGVDNDMRKYFFGEEASTKWQAQELKEKITNFKLYESDIRENKDIEKIFKKHGKDIDIIIHTAAQPSHDWAAKEPFTDFTVNANGTLVMLENYRLHAPKATFIFTSTNKVYGDSPNFLPLEELETRYELNRKHKFFKKGIDETMSIDQSKHSIFGASKVAADVLVQEYGRYFDLNTAVFRGGCLTGPGHSGAELHGFLAYLAKCVATGREYTIFGYKGKQVRDNIHSFDLINAFYNFHKKPRKGEVYNIGGSRHSNTSMKEAIKGFEERLGKKAVIKYSKVNRSGDHIWYISDVSKFQSHYPGWKYKYNNDMIMDDIVAHGHF